MYVFLSSNHLPPLTAHHYHLSVFNQMSFSSFSGWCVHPPDHPGSSFRTATLCSAEILMLSFSSSCMDLKLTRHFKPNESEAVKYSLCDTESGLLVVFETSNKSIYTSCSDRSQRGSKGEGRLSEAGTFTCRINSTHHKSVCKLNLTPKDPETGDQSKLPFGP